MTRPIVRDHDSQIDEIIDREMNDDEFAQNEKDRTEALAKETARVTADAAFTKDRADGLAKLEAAGLTPGQARAVARKDK